MNKENEKYSKVKLYLNEFQFFNGEYDITFNIVDIDNEHIYLRATQDGKVELTNNTIQVADKKYMLNKAM